MEVLSLDKKEECFSMEERDSHSKNNICFVSTLANQIGFSIGSLNNCKPN